MVPKISTLQCPECYKKSLPTVRPVKELSLPELWEKIEKIFNSKNELYK
jgi:hypothetical protein